MSRPLLEVDAFGLGVVVEGLAWSSACTSKRVRSKLEG